jgi:hypothetical protein
MYQLVVRRRIRPAESDFPRVYTDELPEVGAVMDRHVGNELLRLRVTGIRRGRPHSATTAAVDLVDVVEEELAAV